MHCTTEPTNTPSHDTLDRLRQCQTLLTELAELRHQKEDHTKHLSLCEAAIESAKSIAQRSHNTNNRATNAALKAILSTQANLAAHKALVRRHLRTLKRLKSVYRGLILGLLNKADPRWLQHRRKTARAAFRMARDIHSLLRRKSRDLFLRSGGKKKRMSASGVQGRVAKRGGLREVVYVL